MSNPFDKFPEFCSRLTINSKDEGLVPLKHWGSQIELIKQVSAGLEQDIHFFVILKGGRQVGISTECLAITPYWNFKHGGIQGAMVTDTDSNRDYFRSILLDFIESLPRSMKVPIVKGRNNRLGIEWRNLSRMVYMTAGTRKKREGGELGRAKGINYCHCTECSSWADEDELQAFMASLSETYPQRLYLFESTARGFNLFFDMWETASRAKSQKAIFIGWWMCEKYSIPKESNIYRVYWDGKLSSDERQWVTEVKRLYGHEITGEQMAWWRWKLNEMMNGDLNMMYQEFGPTPELCFVMTGYKFFSSMHLTEAYKYALKQPYKSLRYTFGSDFVDTKVHMTTRVNAELKIWEDPKPNGIYVIGADPAYGYNEESDKSVCEVFRCYADRLVQVAEFCSSGVRTDQFAWILLHLAGAYRNTMVNLELTGPGNSVHNELMNVKKRQALLPKNDRNNVMDALSCISWFLYSREDSLAKSFAYHSKTGSEQKELMLNRMKDLWERGEMVVHSCDMINEAKYFARDGAQLEGRGGANDDRVVSVALAVMAFLNWRKMRLIQSGMTYMKVKKDEENEGRSPTANLVLDFLKTRGVAVKR